MEQGPLGLNPELRTPPLPATHVRAGTDHRVLARNYTTDQGRPSYLRVHSPCATSCRNIVWGSAYGTHCPVADERAVDPVAGAATGLSQSSPSSRRTRRMAGHASAPNRWGASSSPPTWYGRLGLSGVSPGRTMGWPALGSSMTTVTRPERARRAAMFLAAWLLGHTLSSPPATRTSSPRNFSTGMVAASTASLPASSRLCS